MPIAEHIRNYRYYSDHEGHLLSGDDWEKYDSSHETPPGAKLPDGWPTKLDSPLAWKGQELQKTPEKYIYVLSGEDKEEIDNAIKAYDLEDLAGINKDTFNLPKLGHKLESFAKELYHGTGVKLVRGLDIKRYDDRERIIAYLGISSYVGDLRDPQGINRALIHIKSIAHVPKDERAPIVVSQQTTDPQMFHSDIGLDIVSLFVLDVPKVGGESLITSSYTIYNILAETRPHIIKLLADPDAWEFFGKPVEGGRLIHYINGKYISYFTTRRFIGYGDLPRDERYPPLNEKQKEAFGAAHWIGYQNALTLPIQVGDIEYLNNLYLQHARHGFEEDEDHRRHVVRLWLRNSKYSSEIKYPPEAQAKIDEGYFPDKYKQEIPLSVLEEEAIKKKYAAKNLTSLYAKPIKE